MPRNVDPASIPVGSGAIEESPVSRFVKTEDPLRTHVTDPIRAHMSATTGVEDAGGFFSSDEVEGALQELGAVSATVPLARQNGWYEAGVQSISSAVTNVNRVITLAGTWRAVCTPGEFDLSGESITLPDASTVWVFVHGTTGVLTQQAGVPDITTLEHVVIGRFTCAGNTVTVKEDGRFFIRNDNRKVSYSVRSDNAAADANSEGTFYSIPAALLWLEIYNPLNVSKKTKLVIRGANTVTATLRVPVDNFELEGEPGASITASAGAPFNLIDLNGKVQVRISKIRLVSNATGSSAIVDGAVTVDGFYADSVRISTGTGTWNKGIYFTSASQDNVRILSAHIDVAGANALAISLKSPSRTHISQSRFDHTGVGPSTGVVLGDRASGGSLGTVTTIQDCRFVGFITTGITAFSSSFELRSNSFVLNDVAALGISLSEGSKDGTITGNEITGTHLASIRVAGLSTAGNQTQGISVVSNRAIGPISYGVVFSGQVRFSSIVNNFVDGWLGGGEVSAVGIQLMSVSSNTPKDIQVSENSVTRCADGICVVGLYDSRATSSITVNTYTNLVAGVSSIVIDGSGILAVAGAPGVNEFQIGASNNATAANLAAALNDPSNNFFATRVHATVSTNVVALYAVAPGSLGNGLVVTNNAPTAVTTANLTGGVDRSIEGVTISENLVTNCARSKLVYGPNSFAGAGSKGIGLDHTFGCKVMDNDVREIGIMLDASGTPSVPSGIGTVLESVGIYLRNSSRVKVAGNAVYNCARNNTGDPAASAHGIWVHQGTSGVEPTFTYVCKGISISNNSVNWESRGNGGALDITGQIGIGTYCDIGSDYSTSSHLLTDLQIHDNQISSASSFGIQLTAGNLVQLTSFKVTGNQTSSCGGGPSTGGINLDISDAAGAVAGQSLVRSGVIGDNSVVSSDGDGISITGTRTASPNGVSGVRVSRNKVFQTAGRGIACSFAVGTLTLSALVIDQNEVLNAGSGGAFSGIYVENTSSSVAEFRNVEILQNSVLGGISSTVPAIALNCAYFAPDGIIIDRNTIEEVDGSQSVGGGIAVAITQPNLGLTRSSISHNRIYCETNGIKVTSTGIPSGLRFEGNSVKVVDNSSRPFWFEANKTTAPAGVQFLGTGFNLCGNLFRGGRGSLFHVLGGLKIADMLISGNSFLDTDSTAAETTGESAAFAFILDSNSGLGLSTDPSVRNLVVEGNTFRACQEEGLVLNLGPGLPGTYVNAQECSGVTVKGNTFAKTAISANGVGGALRVLSCAALRDVIIESNAFSACGVGATSTDGIIQIDFISTNATSMRNCSISHNTCDASPIAFIKLKELAANDAVCPYTNIENLRVCENQVAQLSVPFFWGDLTANAQDYILTNIAIDNNNVGMITGGQNGIYLDLDGDLSGFSASGNKFSGAHASSIYLHGDTVASDRTWSDVSFDQNDLSDFTVAGIRHRIDTGGSDIDVHNLKFTANSFHSAGAGVIAIDVLHNSSTAAAVWEGLTVSGNTARIDHVDAIFVKLDNNLTGATKRCFNFTGNNLIGIGIAGQLAGNWAAGNILLILIVVANSMDGAAVSWAAFGALFNAPVTRSIANNAA